jgi:hypothetical protein
MFSGRYNYGYTMDSPGMIMRVPNVGLQYLMGFMDADKNYLDGGKTYKVTLPPNIPAKNFWSFTVYDNQTRSMLQTPQRFPRAGSQTYPTPSAEVTSPPPHSLVRECPTGPWANGHSPESEFQSGYNPARKVNPVVKRTYEELGLSFSRSPALAGLDQFLQGGSIHCYYSRTVTHWRLSS